MNDFTVQQFSSYNLFQAAGDVIELNAWVPDDTVEQIKLLNANPAKIKQHRINGSADGPENGYWYNNSGYYTDLGGNFAENFGGNVPGNFGGTPPTHPPRMWGAAAPHTPRENI